MFLRYAGENKSITDCAAHRTCCRYYVTACLSGRKIKNFMNYILESRQILIEQGQKNKGKDKYRENMILNVEYAFAFENREHYMKKENKEVTFCMDEFWAFGMATEIARIMNTTRQNIDRYISSGKIKESRTMDKAIFELLGEDIW